MEIDLVLSRAEAKALVDMLESQQFFSSSKRAYSTRVAYPIQTPNIPEYVPTQQERDSIRIKAVVHDEACHRYFTLDLDEVQGIVFIQGIQKATNQKTKMP